MSTKTIVSQTHSCDLCGARKNKEDLTAFTQRRRAAISAFHDNSYALVDVCDECMSRPISELAEAFDKVNPYSEPMTVDTEVFLADAENDEDR